MLLLYRMLVIPHLQHGVQFWFYGKDVIDENVTRSASSVLYGELDYVGLISLEQRRLRRDYLEAYQIMRGTDDVNSYIFPPGR